MQMHRLTITSAARNLIGRNAFWRDHHDDPMICAFQKPHNWFNCHFMWKMIHWHHLRKACIVVGHRFAKAWRVNTVEAPQQPTHSTKADRGKAQNPSTSAESPAIDFPATVKSEIYIQAASLNWLLAIDWNGVNFKRVFSSAGDFRAWPKTCKKGEKPNTTCNKTFQSVFSVEKTSETAGECSDERRKKLFSSAIRSNFLVCCATSNQSWLASISDQLSRKFFPRHRKRY